MSDDIKFLKAENERLHGETLALQWMLAAFMRAVIGSGEVSKSTVAQSLDAAANIVEEIAIRFGKDASSEHTVRALKIVEELRKQVLSGH